MKVVVYCEQIIDYPPDDNQPGNYVTGSGKDSSELPQLLVERGLHLCFFLDSFFSFSFFRVCSNSCHLVITRPFKNDGTPEKEIGIISLVPSGSSLAPCRLVSVWFTGVGGLIDADHVASNESAVCRYIVSTF